MQTASRIVLTVITLGALAGCSAAASAPATGGPAPAASGGAPSTAQVAAATLLATGSSTVNGTAASEGAALTAGSVVAVAKGPAAIRYGDGSIVRLDSKAEFVVGDGPSRGELRKGLSWIRVAPQGSGSFAITVGGTTLTAKGTAFAALAGASTRVSVVEGVVQADAGGTPVDVSAGQLGTVKGTSVTTGSTNWDATFGNPFILKAANADVASMPGAADAAKLASELGRSYASWAGTYAGTRTITKCSGSDCQFARVGDTAKRTYTFAVDCSAGLPCRGQGVTQWASGNAVKTTKLPMSFDGDTMTYSLQPPPVRACADGTGSLATTISWRFTATKAAVVSGAYVVTAAKGSGDAVNKATSRGTCGNPGGSSDGAVVVTRK